MKNLILSITTYLSIIQTAQLITGVRLTAFEFIFAGAVMVGYVYLALKPEERRKQNEKV